MYLDTTASNTGRFVALCFPRSPTWLLISVDCLSLLPRCDTVFCFQMHIWGFYWLNGAVVSPTEE